MNFFPKSLFALIVVLLLFSMGCVSSIEDNQNIPFEDDGWVDGNLGEITPHNQGDNLQDDGVQKQGVEVSSDLGVDAIDCGENLDCLIQAVEEEKEAKAVIESKMVLFDKEYNNTDYLEIFFEGNKIILFRKILNEDGLSGSCEFSKEQAIYFLEKWNENSFNSDYFDEFNCKGEIYDIFDDNGDFE